MAVTLISSVFLAILFIFYVLPACSLRGESGEHVYNHALKNPPKRPKAALGSSEKTFLLNVWNYLQRLFPLEGSTSICERTKDANQLSLSTIKRVRKEFKESDTVCSPIRKRPGAQEKNKRLNRYDSLVFSAIRRKVHMFFFRNEPPTLKKILQEVNQDHDLPNMSKETLRRILKDIGFKYKKRSRNSMLMERDDLILWRIRYLRDISRYLSEGRPVFYLDETWCNAGHSVSRAWHDTCVKDRRSAFYEGLSTGLKELNKGGRITLLHVGSESGFLRGADLICGCASKDCGDLPTDPHKDMNAEKFEKWFTGVLLPKLPPTSVIVLDNASYHSRQIDKAPNSNSLKETMRKWLTDHNISWTNDMLKVQLYDLVKMHKGNQKTYFVDQSAAAAGHTVLRLPPYHCDLNPIEMVWAQIKSHVASHNTSGKLKDVNELLKQGIQLVTDEQWKHYCGKVYEFEEQLKKADCVMDEMVEKFVITVGNESDSDSCDSEFDDSESD